MSDDLEPVSSQYSAYPPGDWSPRGAPTGPEVESALQKARVWWPRAAGDRCDDALEVFLDVFERYLALEVEIREKSDGEETTATKQEKLPV